MFILVCYLNAEEQVQVVLIRGLYLETKAGFFQSCNFERAYCKVLFFLVFFLRFMQGAYVIFEIGCFWRRPQMKNRKVVGWCNSPESDSWRHWKSTISYEQIDAF